MSFQLCEISLYPLSKSHPLSLHPSHLRQGPEFAGFMVLLDTGHFVAVKAFTILTTKELKKY